jgi:uncharacterized protein (DUF169 family)
MAAMEEYIKDVEKIVEALDIEKEPVGVKYSDEDPGTGVEIERGSYTVCGGILEAANGKIIMLSEETCACPGGRSHLGLSQAREVSLEMLVEGEKLWCDVKTARRSGIESEKIAKPPSGLAKKVYLYPVRRGIFRPDLVLMLVNAEQACRLIILNQFWDGKLPSIEMRGSLCWSTVTYPLVSGNFNVSVGDISARRMERWNPCIMTVSIPIERIAGVADAVDKSTAGTAKTSEKFKKMTEKMRSRKV